MAEEHRCQAQQLCANNCGFFGSPTTHNLCSKCYRDLQLKEQQQLSLNQTLISSAAAAAAAASSSSSHRSFSTPLISVPSSHEAETEGVLDAAKEEAEEEEGKVEVVAAAPVVQANRCTTCRRRVGLTGFKCRCGMTFCGTHRYPEQHACGFDFRSMGKEQIARANPVIKAEKLQKI